MARGQRHTIREYAELLIGRIEKYYVAEEKESSDGCIFFEIKGDQGGVCNGPMGIHRGRFGVEVRAEGRVNVRYELFIPQEAQDSYELMSLLNRFNAFPGVTYWVENDAWKGAKLYARQEVYIERFEGAFAGRAANRIFMAAADIQNGLWELAELMPQYFSDEELERAAAEANLSPENLMNLPAEVEVPPEPEYEAETFFDNYCPQELEAEFMPQWYEEWGDEQAFLERFINEPVEQMSGSELIMLGAALKRDICRKQRQIRAAQQMLGEN